MASGLTISSALAQQMVEHARAELPNEACGLLAGSLIEGRASAFHATRNAEASPLRYNVHPDDLVRVILALEDGGEDLVAIFHSHTRSPAVPSATDRRTAQYPDAFYVLATLADPAAALSDSLRAWRIRDGESTEVPIWIG
ncbi:M67 family metallopeptidase [soil metagenome]